MEKNIEKSGVPPRKKLTKEEQRHKVWKDYYTQSYIYCDGEVFWDEGLEGYCCTRCNLYTGVK